MPPRGYKQSAEHIARRVAAWRRSTAPGTMRVVLTQRNKDRVGIPLSEEHRRKIATANKGRQFCLGHKQSPEHRRKLSEYWQKHREQHNHYKDGKGAERTSARHEDMARLDYRLWREAVFQRDNYTCRDCNCKGGDLHAHHVKTYAEHPELRYEVSNGETLCVECHRKRHSGGDQCHKTT